MNVFRQWLTRFFFKRLYSRFYQKGWTIICKSPLYLNVAFPDHSVQYFVSSFAQNSQVQLYGRLPPISQVSYMAITVYDTLGLPASSLIDSTLRSRFGEKYRVVVGKDLSTPTDSAFCIIIRFYVMDPSDHRLHLEWLPTLLYQQDQQCQDQISTVPLRIMQQRTKQVEQRVISFLSKRFLLFVPEYQFFLPAYKQMVSLFVNDHARYLIAYPKKNHVFRIEGILPHTISAQSSLRFIGFMACNMQTTETDDSVSYMSLSQKYVIWMARSKTIASRYGYDYRDPSHCLLLWKTSNANPLVVYREVRIDRKGLFSVSHENEKVSAEQCQCLMGKYYPKICSW